MDLDFKLRYNQLINRLAKADNYLDDKSKPDESKMPWLKEYNKIIISISDMQTEYQKVTRKEMPKEIRIYGFNIDSKLL